MRAEPSVSQQAPKPFACRHAPDLPELLADLRCSLLVSTYQAGKLIAISSDGDRIVQLPRTFEVPMGLAVDGERMAVATRDAIVMLVNEPRLAPTYPRQPGQYDALYVPRSVHFCGRLAIHDMVWTDEGLIGVNTLFSCLFRLDPAFSFVPVWQPPFVSALAPEDRCHLNGLAMHGGAPRYATALGAGDVAGAWREGKERGGVLLDVPSGEVVLGGLPMPHTPRIYAGQLYVLLSATGELVAVDVGRGEYEVVRRVEGFARGMTLVGEYLFVASSRVRANHTFGDLGLERDGRRFCGITVIHLPSGALAGELEYLRSCEEIYDVQALHGIRRPGLLGIADPTYLRALSTPEQSYWGAEENAPPRGDRG